MKKSFDLVGFNNSPIDFDIVSEDVALEAKGTIGSILLEPIPHFNKTESEEVIQGKNNSWIVLGRDRPGNKLTRLWW